MILLVVVIWMAATEVEMVAVLAMASSRSLCQQPLARRRPAREKSPYQRAIELETICDAQVAV